MRGFADNSVDNIYLDGLKAMGDSGTFSSMQVDPYFLERIDVLKGRPRCSTAVACRAAWWR
ncbi:hypothetical protein P4233_15420 [Pseudomonas aeruginosa]|nr:hypothetical protein [Pseudomonas aeruginosa]